MPHKNHSFMSARPSRWRAVPRITAWAAAVACAAAAHAQGTPPAVPAVALAQTPLYGGGSSAQTDKPTMTLALSVEFPTAGALYTSNNNLPENTLAAIYRADREYIGYYNAQSCYVYNDNPATPAGASKADYKHFERIGAAANRQCADAFSGNFLNWASSSAIDMLRMALSGGDRVVDTPEMTILQRAVTPGGVAGSLCQANSQTFPRKVLWKDGGGRNAYWGAIPQSMRQDAGGKNIWIGNMLNRIHFGTQNTGNNDCAGVSQRYKLGQGKLNSEGFFYARVRVCESRGGVLQDQRDYDFCEKYPSGYYKPVGAIQRYAERMRFAAFGYLIENFGDSRWGGVLRAPMKYVGHKTFDIHGRELAGTNPRAEWSSDTGVFTKNPENDALGISGVINYLNRFGRTGPVPGVYKRNDPLSELYYESLRYLQGLQPTPAAVSNITARQKDGFPAYTQWADPYGDGRSKDADYSCQSSNIVIIGDNNSQQENWRGLGKGANPANNVPDFRHWYNVVDRFERKSGGTYVDGQGQSRSIARSGSPNAASGAWANRRQLGAYAYWAHTHDIRGDFWTAAGDKLRRGLRVKTFAFDVNEIDQSSNPAFRRQTSQLFMAAKYGGFETNPSNKLKAPYNTWGNPFKSEDGSDNDDVWQKPGQPGEAATYHFMQGDPRGVLTAFDDIFSAAAISMSGRGIGGVATSSPHIADGTVLYSSKVDTSSWSGDVLAEPLAINGANASLGTVQWSAAERLDARANPAGTRNIFIGNGNGASPFTWAGLNTAQQDAIENGQSGTGADRLAWLRGDKRRERKNGGPFRDRASLLGDIIHSNVVYSGAPQALHMADAGYQQFQAQHKNRTRAVFAGANDGMLHAFHAATGDELFAYIPSWLTPRLAALSAPDFDEAHQSYVDAPLAIGEAQSAGGAWKTVLTGGTGAGGSGVFALDVTNPAAFGADNLLWEFTRADDADIGQVVGTPRILKFQTRASSAGQAAQYRWFVAVASGVNNHLEETAGGPKSATGDPALFLLALDKGAGTPWVQGSNYFKITLPKDTALIDKAPGAVNLSAVLNAAGAVSHVYIGDLHGRLWKLYFEPLASGDWTLDKLSYFRDNGRAVPYFRALDNTGKVQPISAAPTVFYGGKQTYMGGGGTGHGRDAFGERHPGMRQVYFVSVGTGKYLEPGDNADTAQQSMYFLYDEIFADAPSHATYLNGSLPYGRKRPDPSGGSFGVRVLAAATLDAATGTLTLPAGMRKLSWGTDTNDGGRAGWYIDLPESGERVIAQPVPVGEGYHVAFSTVIPGSGVQQTAGCGASADVGNANNYVVDILDSKGEVQASNVGLLGHNGSLFYTDEAATTKTVTDSTGQAVRTTVSYPLNVGQSGVETGQRVELQETVGRLSYRPIFNFRELQGSTP